MTGMRPRLALIAAMVCAAACGGAEVGGLRDSFAHQLAANQSSWYADGPRVEPSGRDSNLPLELTDNGLAQDCWAV